MAYGHLVIQRSRSNPPGTIYIGRPGPWGNPFHVEHGGRLQAVRSFGQALVDGELEYGLAEVRFELVGRHLACFCAPQLCHGHVLACVANEVDGVERVKRWLDIEHVKSMRG